MPPDVTGFHKGIQTGLFNVTRICTEKNECRFRGRLNHLESCKGIAGCAVRRRCCCLKCRISCPMSPLVVDCIQFLFSQIGKISKGSTSWKSSHFDIFTITQFNCDSTMKKCLKCKFVGVCRVRNIQILKKYIRGCHPKPFPHFVTLYRPNY